MPATFKPVPRGEVQVGIPFITIDLHFGPQFMQLSTNKQFIDELRKEADKHANSFIKNMMTHAAEHIEAADPSLKNKPRLAVRSAYHHVGSCDTCGSPECCLCEYDGQLWCERC